MTITPSVCPECGKQVHGSVDLIPGTAMLEAHEDGTFDYCGETTVHWEGQYSVENEAGLPFVCCEDGHEWGATIEDDDDAP